MPTIELTNEELYFLAGAAQNQVEILYDYGGIGPDGIEVKDHNRHIEDRCQVLIDRLMAAGGKEHIPK